MAKLRPTLCAELLWKLDNKDRSYYANCTDLAQAQGVMFLCPVCIGKNVQHYVICWFNNRGVDPSVQPNPGRWNPGGTSLDDLTFVPPGAVSVQLIGGCDWHGFVINGEAN